MPTRTYVMPDLNLMCNRWPSGTTPSGGPFLEALPCQLYESSVFYSGGQLVQVRLGWLSWTGTISIVQSGAADIFEVPAGSGRFYKGWAMVPMHEGFPNQFLAVSAIRCNAAGVFLTATTFP